MRQSAISFRSRRLDLEGIISTPGEASGAVPGMVVCHSHPMLGGSMADPVVVAICRAADAAGLATLRFNFRGVGESQGEFTNGREEHRDAEAALNVLRAWPGVNGKLVAVAGYSTGAAVILDNMKAFRRAHAIVLVAPTLKAMQVGRFKSDRRPRLVIAGQNDRLAPSLEIQRELDQARQPIMFAELPGADHGMSGHEREIANAVTEFIGSWLE